MRGTVLVFTFRVYWSGREARAVSRILVVEDDPATLMFLTDALESEGYQVAPASDGRAALDYLESCGRYQPDAILLDLYLPLVDGQEVAAAYGKLAVHHAPIVVVSAALDAVRRAASMRVSGALVKPVALDELLDRVRTVVTG